ncbi:hypothetical protein EYF80_033787 [Liparis tanakae]|uniref:Uncharacterized protein n=1 Tax=Liparis tanakae TaxID=230148 RepID=A0A4Z2GTF0_9TELE|nr:hypothetical protein EYF80_033787 [Liparis tanakae]
MLAVLCIQGEAALSHQSVVFITASPSLSPRHTAPSQDWNTGGRNIRNWNTGDWNSGDRNIRNWNTGDWNSGDRNIKDWNRRRNAGDWNRRRNAGDWNRNWNG